MLMNIIAGIIICIVLVVLVIYAYLKHTGVENLVPQIDSRTPFAIDALTDDSVTIGTTIDFQNLGPQCVVIMDCFVRPHLPFEQYDGLEVRGHADLVESPREDDYFEAVIAQRAGYKTGEDHRPIRTQVKMIARKGMTIKEAVSKMPDFNFEIIWREGGRTPSHFSQTRIEVPAAEVAALLGVELIED